MIRNLWCVLQEEMKRKLWCRGVLFERERRESLHQRYLVKIREAKFCGKCQNGFLAVCKKMLRNQAVESFCLEKLQLFSLCHDGFKLYSLHENGGQACLSGPRGDKYNLVHSALAVVDSRCKQNHISSCHGTKMHLCQQVIMKPVIMTRRDVGRCARIMTNRTCCLVRKHCALDYNEELLASSDRVTVLMTPHVDHHEVQLVRRLKAFTARGCESMHDEPTDT